MVTNRERLLDYMAGGRIIRYRDLAHVPGGPIPAITLFRLLKEEKVYPQAGGYSLPVEEFILSDRAQRLVELSRKHPEGVLCYFSALRALEATGAFRDVQDITDEMNPEDTIAIPLSPSMNLRSGVDGARALSWAKPEMFTVGVEEATLGGVCIRYTNFERTVADLFMPGRGQRTAIAKEPAIKILKKLLEMRGPDAVTLAGNYAGQLGWQKYTDDLFTGMKEAYSCAPQMR